MNSDKNTGCRIQKRPRYGALISFALVIFPAFANAQEGRNPNLEGMWIEAISSYTDPRWRLEDLVCINCSRAAFEYLQTLMAQNEERSFTELRSAMGEFEKEYIWGLLTKEGRERYNEVESAPDPGCEPAGLLQMVRGWLSVRIEENDDRITLQYEYLGPTRTVYMDGRGHPSDLEPSFLGHSIGWYDGPTLVVETTGLKPNVVRSSGKVDGIRISDDARVIERYTRNEDDTWFDHEVTLVDPRMYREPFVVHKQKRLLERGQDFEIYTCEVVSGQPDL